MSTSNSDFRTAVLAATDIVQLIGQSVALKRRGRSYLGLCPFHQEKTPSFHVNAAKQFFHCFGCKASGNAIDFVIKRDRVEFLDALKSLGEKAGLEMPRYGVGKEKTGQRQALLQATSAACMLFEKLLSHPQQGLAARQYLEQRGISAESIKRFQIGLAADSWDYLLSNLSRKFPPAQLQAAGLVKARESGEGHYDAFRNRLMFPIRDESSQLIAFGGRVMPGSDDPAKYLNSPETPLFSKSRCIFGLDLARQRIVETRTAVIVEGYTDVVMAHQFGLSNVVSILGTALTEQHLKILKRFAERVVFLFDADAAGDAAIERSIELGLINDIQIGIASLPDGLDPDELLLQKGAAAFQELIDKAQDVLSYGWQNIIARESVKGVLQKEQAVKQYLLPLERARAYGGIDPIRWGFVLTRVSRLLEIAPQQLNGYLSIRKTMNREASAEAAQQQVKSPPPGAANRAERWLLGVLLSEPQRWREAQRHVTVSDFTDEPCRRLAEAFWKQQQDEGESALNEFLGELADPRLTELAVELVDEVEQLADAQRTLESAVAFMAEHRKRRCSEQKLVADLRRTTADGAQECDQVEVLRRLQESARRPDLRRV